jgi:hypothetical protein
VKYDKMIPLSAQHDDFIMITWCRQHENMITLSMYHETIPCYHDNMLSNFSFVENFPHWMRRTGLACRINCFGAKIFHRVNKATVVPVTKLLWIFCFCVPVLNKCAHRKRHHSEIVANSCEFSGIFTKSERPF